jgi:hypothetical protein
MDKFSEQLISSVFGALIGGLLTLKGVTLANSLNNKNIKREKEKRINHLKRILEEELESILGQIPNKIDMINQAVKHMELEKNFLPLKGVGIVNTVYTQNISELHSYLTKQERNCLHVIYERLFFADEELNSFENNFKMDYMNKIIQKPFLAYRNRLGELVKSYGVVVTLINSYLSNMPVDVFPIELISTTKQLHTPGV